MVCSDCSAEDSKSYTFRTAVGDMLNEFMTARVLGAALCEYTEVFTQTKKYGQKNVDLNI